MKSRSMWSVPEKLGFVWHAKSFLRFVWRNPEKLGFVWHTKREKAGICHAKREKLGSPPRQTRKARTGATPNAKS